MSEFTFIISSDYPKKEIIKEILYGKDLPDAIVTFMQCIHNFPDYIFTLTYNGKAKEGMQ